jgi:WD40 repeat protein
MSRRFLLRRGATLAAVLLVGGTLLADRAAAQPPAADFKQSALAWSLPWDEDWVTAVCFLGNNRVAAGNNRGHILVWELPDKPGGAAPAPLFRLDGHDNVINRLVTTPDGWLISASSDHTVRYWDLKVPPKTQGVVVLNARAIEEAAVRKKKTPPPVERKVGVYEATQVLKAHQDWVLGLAVTPDGNLLLTGDDKGDVIVWDRVAAKELRRWKIKGQVWALAVSPDGKTAAVSERTHLVFDSGRHAAVKLWDVQTGKPKVEVKDLDKQMIAAAAFSPDGKTLAAVRGGEIDGQNGKVILLDATSGKKLRELMPGHLNGATDVLFHADGKHLFSSGRDTTVKVWSVADGKLVKELGQGRGGQFKDWIHAVAVSPDSRWLAAADMAGQVQVYALHGK